MEATLGWRPRHMPRTGVHARSRGQIEAVIRRRMEEQPGIERYDWDDRFVEDLGVD